MGEVEPAHPLGPFLFQPSLCSPPVKSVTQSDQETEDRGVSSWSDLLDDHLQVDMSQQWWTVCVELSLNLL